MFRSLRYNCGLTNHTKLPRLQTFLLPDVCSLQLLWHSNCNWNLAVSIQVRSWVHPPSGIPVLLELLLRSGKAQSQRPPAQCLTAWDPGKKWGCSNIHFFAYYWVLFASGRWGDSGHPSGMVWTAALISQQYLIHWTKSNQSQGRKQRRKGGMFSVLKAGLTCHHYTQLTGLQLN